MGTHQNEPSSCHGGVRHDGGDGEGTRRHETRRRAQEGAVAKARTPRKTHKVRARARACEEEAGNARTREAMPREHGCPAPQGAQVSVTRLFPTLLGHTVYTETAF